jgi:hypothetical protein
MKKSDRQKIFNKYDGHCAYCGCELEKGWHVDEIEPVRRRYKTVAGGWALDGKVLPKSEWIHLSEDDIITKGLKWMDSRTIPDGYDNPENLCIENQNPSCASCNINKHSDSLEGFRSLIAGFVKSLNRDSTQYKIAKRYGLIQETGIDVKFYFETQNTKR